MDVKSSTIWILIAFMLSLSLSLLVVALPYFGIAVNELSDWFAIPLAVVLFSTSSVIGFRYTKYQLTKQFGALRKWMPILFIGMLLCMCFIGYAMVFNETIALAGVLVGFVITNYGIYLMSREHHRTESYVKS